MRQETDTNIQFSGLKPGRYNYHYTLTNAFFEEFENDDIKDATVDFEVELERLEHTLMFKFELKGVITVLCDRCLDELTLPIEGEERLCVRFSDSEQCDDDEVAILPTDAYQIDLAEWMYEYVAVRIPLQHTHPDGDCNPEMVSHLTAQTAEADNKVDPRWEALLKLNNK